VGGRGEGEIRERGGAGGMIAFDASNKVTPRGDGVSPFLQLASGSLVADTRAHAEEGGEKDGREGASDERAQGGLPRLTASVHTLI